MDIPCPQRARMKLVRVHLHVEHSFTNSDFGRYDFLLGVQGHIRNIS